MLDDPTRRKLLTRLRRIEGQVSGLQRMLEDQAYCVDVLLQISAVQGALGKVGQIMLDSHVRSCVHQAFASGDEQAREDKIDELMEVFARYAG